MFKQTAVKNSSARFEKRENGVGKNVISTEIVGGGQGKCQSANLAAFKTQNSCRFRAKKVFACGCDWASLFSGVKFESLELS